MLGMSQFDWFDKKISMNYWETHFLMISLMKKYLQTLDNHYYKLTEDLAI